MSDHVSGNVQVSLDLALEVVAELEDPIKLDTGAMVVYTGHHPQHGRLHIVIPPMGMSLFLPAA